MFGAKYSRLKYWVILLLLLIPTFPLMIIDQVMERGGIDESFNLLLAIGFLAIGFFQLNTLANRIRDYGSNPWYALLALIPLVNLGVGLYYGIVQYKKQQLR